MPLKSIKVPVGSELHARLKKAIIDRRRLSQRKMQDFTKQWSDADDSMRAYIHEKDVDKTRKHDKRYKGEVDYVTLEVPYAYAIIMTAHTYFTSVMLGRSPVWQFTGRHGESQDSIQAVEAIMDYQLKNGAMLPVMYNWIYDLCKYSLGIVGMFWEREERVIANFVDEPITVMGVTFPGTRRVRKEEILLGYEGNKLYNVRPFDFLPDPRVPVWQFQEGEFAGRVTSEDLPRCSRATRRIRIRTST